MAKVFRRGLIALEDLNVGTGTFSRGKSDGSSQTVTKINLSGLGGFSVSTITTTPYSATTAEEFLLVNAASSAITVNLPTAVGNTGMVFTIKKIDSSSNAVTIDASSTQTIDGGLTYVLTLQNEYVEIVSDGSNWHIIGAS